MPTNNHSDNISDGLPPLDDEQLWDLLSLYVDGEADPAQAAIVEQMLSSDPAYRRDFDFLMASSKTMHMVEEIEPPASLREAVLAKTSRRPTLVGRLRAAWNRATSPTFPAFGRYATAGGAFAVVALGAVIFQPHLNSGSGTGTLQPNVATRNTHEGPLVTDSRLQEFILPTFTFAGLAFNSAIISTPPSHPKEITPTPKSNGATNLAKAVKLHIADKQSANKVANRGKSALRNYPLPKNNGFHPELAKDSVPGYPYSLKMDEGVARHEAGTIAAVSGNDFGPRVVPYDEMPTPLQPEHKASTTSAGNNGDGGTVPAPEPKPLRRVAVLPPDVKYNLTAEALRPRQSTRPDNFDRSIADSGQRRDVMTLYKSSF